jgi:hypothetical protein
MPLDRGQQAQAETSRDEAGRATDARLYDACRWLLVPEQQGTEPLHWNISSVVGGGLASMGALVPRASQKLVAEGLLVTEWSPLLLKRELDEWVWKDGQPHVTLKQVWNYLTTYLYFTRLKDVEVFKDAVRKGVRTREYFGYADGVEGDRYAGLVFGDLPPAVHVNEVSVLVRPEIAEAQKPEAPPVVEGGRPAPVPPESAPPTPARPTRFHGTLHLDPLKLSSSAGKVGDEVVQHLQGLLGSEVEITLEIVAKVADGVPEDVVRTVLENARVLKFENFGFEEE